MNLLQTLRLYLVTDPVCVGPRSLLEVVAQAVQGGVTCVQLREKNLNTRDFVAQATALQRLLEPLHIPLVINDRVDVALACGAQGVHLGQSDLPVHAARRLLPPGVFIGWSVGNLDQLQQSAHLPLDYLGVSPIFSTPTKTDTGAPWGLSGLAQAREHTKLPLVAIGGIQLDNAAAVLQSGADGLAVVSAICAQAEPRQAAWQLRRIVETQRPSSTP